MDGNQLIRARQEISGIDREMARLFEARMKAVRKIAAYKRARGLPVLDDAQERAVLERNAAFIETEELREFYAQFLRAVMDVSKDYQRRLMEDVESSPSEAVLGETKA